MLPPPPWPIGQIVTALQRDIPQVYRSDSGKLVALGLTDAAGNYSFEGVPAGLYRLQATAVQYHPVERVGLPVRDDRTLRVSFEMLPVDLPAAGVPAR